MKLEVCANSFQSALNAEKAGAHRIELCSELAVGGITPSYALLKKVSEDIKIPVNVLIRPRSGDFCYSEVEFELMKENIKLCKKLGFNGIVSGVLNTNKTIDIKRTQELIKLSKPMSFTFHRAFDCVQNPKESLQQLINLKVDRVLTSGLKQKASDGIILLKQLQETAKEKLVILAGSGINSENAKDFKKAGLKEIHASTSIEVAQEKTLFNMRQTVSSIKEIKAILKVIKE